MNLLTEYRILDGDPKSTEYDVSLYNFWKDEKLHEVEHLPEEWIDEMIEEGTITEEKVSELIYTDKDLINDLVDRGVNPESVDRLNDYSVIDHQGTYIFLNSFNLKYQLKYLTRKEKEQLLQDWNNFKVLN